MSQSTAARLGITSGARVWFSPTEWLWMLGPLPPGATVTGEFAMSTVALILVSNTASVRWFVDRYRTSMFMPRTLWIGYPTRGRTDFNRALLVTMLGAHGLSPVREVPFDASWTAMEVRHLVPGGHPPAR